MNATLVMQALVDEAGAERAHALIADRTCPSWCQDDQEMLEEGQGWVFHRRLVGSLVLGDGTIITICLQAEEHLAVTDAGRQSTVAPVHVDIDDIPVTVTRADMQELRQALLDAQRAADALNS